MALAVFPKRILIAAVILAALSLLLLAPAFGHSAARADGDIIPGKYIVVVNNGYDPQQIASDHGEFAERVYVQAAHGYSARLSDTQVAELRGDPRVNNVVPDHYVYASDEGGNAERRPGGSGSGGSGSIGTQVIPAGVQRVGAPTEWAKGVTGTGVGIAVIDTGIDFNQTDLQPVSATCFTAYSSCQDDNGHGTHVSGIIAARDNGQGVVGVAPGATLYAVKVLNSSGSGTWSSVMAGVDWVTAHAGSIQVANMSLGGAGSNSANCGDPDNNGIIDDPLHRSICNSVAAGVTYVVAAGNNSSQEITQQVPAAYPEVMAIASTSAVDGNNSCRSYSGRIYADTASYFTTDGAGVAISAPGEEREDISRGCFVSSIGILSTKLGGGTTRMSGTSMASPHVAGIAALVKQVQPALTPAGVRSSITSGALRIGVAPLDSPTSGYSFDGVREGIGSATSAGP